MTNFFRTLSKAPPKKGPIVAAIIFGIEAIVEA